MPHPFTGTVARGLRSHFSLTYSSNDMDRGSVDSLNNHRFHSVVSPSTQSFTFTFSRVRRVLLKLLGKTQRTWRVREVKLVGFCGNSK